MTTAQNAAVGPAADAPTWPEEFAERYRAAGYWRGETFGEMLRARADRHPDRIALVDPAPTRRTWTYRELDERADRLAAGFAARGVSAGDRVVVQLPNIGEFIEVVFALFRVGALPVYALPAHRDTEIGYFCSFAEAVAYVVPDRHAGFDHRALATEVKAATPTLRHVFVVGDPGEHTALSEVAGDPAATGPVEGPAAHEPAFLQLSGGTTGVPKLIPRTHDDYTYSLVGSNEICGVDADTRYLVALPAAHNFPMSSPGWLGVLHAGGRVVMCPRPDPETAFPLVQDEGVTMTGLVPPLALVWTEAGPKTRYDLSTLDVLLVGGAKYSEEAARRLEPALGCRLQQVFGMAEGLVNYTRLDDDHETVVTTQGLPISPDDEIRVVDDTDRDVPEGEFGHLLTRGPYTIRGYWRAPEHNARSFTEDGFYRTGDIVRRTPTGHLVVEGRAKDQINRGGEKVAPEEVENIVLAHPSVHDVSVVAAADPYLGERTLAYVILREGAGPLKPVEIKRFVRERGIAAYKVPDLVEFVDAFPRTGVGKVSKNGLRDAAAVEERQAAVADGQRPAAALDESRAAVRKRRPAAVADEPQAVAVEGRPAPVPEGRPAAVPDEPQAAPATPDEAQATPAATDEPHTAVPEAQH
ncbi:(2,3-dihydroxybenzoyl)adenylate synthase [Streptomyces tsukubensis]|uniref:(2,3-dihydroxybenzoyl)adenylate synthase n=1 Tax=Streptomyces tsukubensis TaxID=83656 RepID=UPI002685FB62|nr:(2,3-dihydroxybenzoyl)adenylate synthase [Streptomyces tsukubensis]